MQPGSVISKQEVAKEFGFSQGPVRDAIIRLEAIGLVDVIPQSKTSVSLIDVKDAKDMQFLRISAEVEVARRLAETIEDDQIIKLNTLIERLAFELKTNDLAAFKKVDAQFHEEMFRCVGVEEVLSLMESRWGHYDRIRGLYLMDINRRQEVIDDHQKIVDALASRSTEMSARAARRHLGKSLAVVEQIQERFPSYFL